MARQGRKRSSYIADFDSAAAFLQSTARFLQERTSPPSASVKGRFIGVAPEKYPSDFGSFGSYYRDVKQIPASYPMPEPLELADLAAFNEDRAGSYAAEWQGLR